MLFDSDFHQRGMIVAPVPLEKDQEFCVDSFHFGGDRESERVGWYSCNKKLDVKMTKK